MMRMRMVTVRNDNNGDADELELDTSEAVEQQCWWQHGEREPRHQIDNEDDNWSRWLRSFAIVDKVVHEDKTNLMTGMTCPPLAPRLTTPSQDNTYCAPQTLFTWLGCSCPVSWLQHFQNYTGSNCKTTIQSKLPRSRELKFSLISIACDQVAACSVSRFSAAGFGFHPTTQQANMAKKMSYVDDDCISEWSVVILIVVLHPPAIKQWSGNFERGLSVKGDCFSRSPRSQNDCGKRKIIVHSFRTFYRNDAKPLEYVARGWGEALFFAKILIYTYGENDSGSNQAGRKSHKFCSPISRLKNTNTSLIKLVAAPLVEMPMREHLSPSNHRRHLHLLTVQYLITREKTFGYFNTSSSVY